MGQYIESFDDTLAEAIATVCIDARDAIRSEAKSDPEWAPYADLIDVEFSGGEFHYVLVGPQDQIDAALAVEYGEVEGHAPNSILRKLAMSQAHGMGKNLSDQLSRGVPVA